MHTLGMILNPYVTYMSVEAQCDRQTHAFTGFYPIWGFGMLFDFLLGRADVYLAGVTFKLRQFVWDAELMLAIAKEVDSGRLPERAGEGMEELYRNYRDAVCFLSLLCTM